MQKKFMDDTPFGRAYQSWFADYERQRRQQKKRRGASLDDFPPPPTHPDDVRAQVEKIGRQRVLTVLAIHRATLTRWCNGSAVIPRPAWLLLVLMAEGRLPGMSDDWSQFRFDGDRLHIIGTRHSYTALEIAGWCYQQAHAAALSRQVSDLKGQVRHLLNIGQFEAANDPIARAG